MEKEIPAKAWHLPYVQMFTVTRIKDILTGRSQLNDV